MKKLLAIIVLVTLTGCSTVKSWVPSFWDDNQSSSIINLRLSIERLDCTKPQLPQVAGIRDQVTWFELYSESKGWRQADVLGVVAPMKESIDDFYKRSQAAQGSQTYCEIKKKLLQTQARTAASAVLGRF
jgi:hypothetical protein